MFKSPKKYSKEIKKFLKILKKNIKKNKKTFPIYHIKNKQQNKFT